jgi:hypothetical protein
MEDVALEVPVTSAEAHLDLLLAEELALNSQFLRRFIEPLWASLKPGPVPDDLAPVARLNVWDDGGSGCLAADAGENDIDLLVTSGEEALRVLIEDKVWAVFQPDQGDRYQRRARSRGDGTVLVAPRSRLANTDHTKCFQVTYGIEDVSDWLVEQARSTDGQWAHRLRWRAELLRQLCRPTGYVPKPDHPPTVAFTAFCTDWLAAHEPRAVPNAKSLRTNGSGWLWFTSPSGLVYKAAHGRVDLYVTEHGFKGTAEDLAAAVAGGWAPDGFTAAVDTSGNPVLRFEHPGIKAYSQDGVPSDVSGVVMALTAVVTAVRWVVETSDAITLPTT